MNKIEEAAAFMENIMRTNRKNMIERIRQGGKGELFILKYLNDKDKPVIPSEISEAMNTSTARISAVLGSLEKKGQISREINKANRRNILVTITKKGRERHHTEIQQVHEHMIKIFTEMGEKDATEFIRLSKCFHEIANCVFNDGKEIDIQRN